MLPKNKVGMGMGMGIIDSNFLSFYILLVVFVWVQPVVGDGVDSRNQQSATYFNQSLHSPTCGYLVNQTLYVSLDALGGNPTVLSDRTSFVGFSPSSGSTTDNIIDKNMMRRKVWAIPQEERMLQIGVPVNKGFNEFVRVEKDDDTTNEYKVTGGFTIEVFQAILRELPFKVDPIFHPILLGKESAAKNYDHLRKGIPDKSYDIVVGDTTILANRASFVDFTLPYLASKVFVIVPIEHDKCKSMWMFLKPFSPELWLTVSIASMFVGLVLVFLERRVNNSKFGGPLHQQFFMLFCLPLSMLVFQQWGLANKWSKFVLFIWFCVAYIVMQSYTANLSLMLTADQTRAALPKEFHYVGYQEGSFVKELLIKEFNFTESQLKQYSTIEEYHKALPRGSRNGGVDCIYDELPYINLFLRKYSSKYTMVGPIYDTAGFGFALLCSHFFSRAVLNVAESSKMRELKEKYFGEGHSSQSDQPSSNSPANPSLGAYSFVGLFMMTAAATLLVIICSECSLKVRSINQRPPSDRIDSRVDYSIEMINVGGGCDQEHPPPTTTLGTGEFSVDEGQEAEEKEEH